MSHSVLQGGGLLTRCLMFGPCLALGDRSSKEVHRHRRRWWWMWVIGFPAAAICRETPGVLQGGRVSSDPRGVPVTVSKRWINFDSHFLGRSSTPLLTWYPTSSHPFYFFPQPYSTQRNWVSFRGQRFPPGWFICSEDFFPHALWIGFI